MTPETIASLINLGAAGAVIIVVWKFLDFIKKLNDEQRLANERRDKQWQDFFTALNSSNQNDISDMRQVSERITKALDTLLLNYNSHDTQAKQIGTVVTEIRGLVLELKSKPMPKATGRA